MAHIQTKAIEVKSDTRDGAYLNFYDESFPGVGIWHLIHQHPQFVHIRNGIVSYLVFDHWNAALEWMAESVCIGDRVYEVRDTEVVEMTESVLNSQNTMHKSASPATNP